MAAGVIGAEDDAGVLCAPGIEEFITSAALLSLLGIPATGLLRISAALLLIGDNEMYAYWWRDRYTGQQFAELRDPVLVNAAFSNAFIDSGYLPAGVIRLGISQKARWMAVHVPPAAYTLTLLDDQQQPYTITLGLPGFVLYGYSHQYWMWAVKDHQVSAHTPVFRYPLPNVGGDGTMCFGSNQPPQADGPTMMQALSLFFDSPFNNHWATAKALSHPGDIRAYLHELAGHRGKRKRALPVFPEEELVPITATDAPQLELTLDHLLRHVLSRREPL